MNTEMSSFEVELSDFVKNGFLDKSALMISGKWGSGKTHFVEKWKEKFIAESDKESKTVYFSIFGMKNSDEILEGIFNSAIQTKTGNALDFAVSFGSMVTARALDEKWKEEREKKIKDFANYSKLLIILDDFERCQINMTERFGVIDRLTNAGAKVIVVCNEDEIVDKADKEVYARTYEKVFARKIRITNTPEHLTQVLMGLSIPTQIIDIVSDIHKKSESDNLRTYIRCVEALARMIQRSNSDENFVLQSFIFDFCVLFYELAAGELYIQQRTTFCKAEVLFSGAKYVSDPGFERMIAEYNEHDGRDIDEHESEKQKNRERQFEIGTKLRKKYFEYSTQILESFSAQEWKAYSCGDSSGIMEAMNQTIREAPPIRDKPEYEEAIEHYWNYYHSSDTEFKEAKALLGQHFSDNRITEIPFIYKVFINQERLWNLLEEERIFDAENYVERNKSKLDFSVFLNFIDSATLPKSEEPGFKALTEKVQKLNKEIRRERDTRAVEKNPRAFYKKCEPILEEIDFEVFKESLESTAPMHLQTLCEELAQRYKPNSNRRILANRSRFDRSKTFFDKLQKYLEERLKQGGEAPTLVPLIESKKFIESILDFIKKTSEKVTTAQK